MSNILSKTQNFLTLYQHVCGKSEVPSMYNFWAAISLISSTVEDRVWYRKFAHEKLYANLFIVLIGPSGLGKGTAISHAVRLAERSITINKFRGRCTSAHLIDHLGKITEDEYGDRILSNPRLWLIMDELQNDVSTNKKLVEDFVYLMTELYTASNYTFDSGTRTHGAVRISNPIINWLVGSTEECMRSVITPEVLNTGFPARTCFIFADYNFDLRCSEIVYPPDYEEVMLHLQQRLWVLQRTKGEMCITQAAKDKMDNWYNERPNPDNEVLYSMWKRQPDLLIKFAMILCLADGKDLVIKYPHVLGALKMVDKIYSFVSLLVAVTRSTEKTRLGDFVLRYLRKKKEGVGHSELARHLRSTQGIDAITFRKLMFELEIGGYVKKEAGSHKKIFYFYGDF